MTKKLSKAHDGKKKAEVKAAFEAMMKKKRDEMEAEKHKLVDEEVK